MSTLCRILWGIQWCMLSNFFFWGKKVIKENIMAGSVTKIAQFVEFCTSQMLNIT